MIKSIKDLWDRQTDMWRKENEFYFGISTLSEWIKEEEITKHLSECMEKFWNNGTNEFKELLLNGKCKDIEKMVPGSWELVFDPKFNIICLNATFNYKVDENGEEPSIERKSPLAYLPVPTNLGWFLGETEWILRITATPNYGLIRRNGNICNYQRMWSFNTETKEFLLSDKAEQESLDPYEILTKVNKQFLSSMIRCKPEELDKEKFIEALTMIPEFNPSSVLYFQFSQMDSMFAQVAQSSRFCNPLMRVAITINVVKMFISNRVREDNVDQGLFNNLVLYTNDLSALENIRTIIYKAAYNNAFMFTDTDFFFDAFKTSTNKSAGKSRLLLDNAWVKDGYLWCGAIGANKEMTDTNMFDILLYKEEYSKCKNISVLLSSRFDVNNAEKRMMMTGKLRAQAVPVAGESDPFTHEIPARVVFGDYKGFNFGDSIIISRSFARNLRSKYKAKRWIANKKMYSYLESKYSVGDYIDIDDYSMAIGTPMNDNFRNIRLTSLSNEYMSIEAEAPFSVGDKITNLHGSKGVVSLILEDDEMPYLKNDIVDENGTVFPAGPFDLILSGLSVHRRKSLGQLFEAWGLATDHNDIDNIEEAAEKYSDSLIKFSDQSIVVFKNQEAIKPCGINMILRLDHNSVSKQSQSYIKSNYAKMLKLGEMEILNLAARGLFEIMNELDIRSISKHYDSFEMIQNMQMTGNITQEEANNLRFFNTLYIIGWESNLRNMNSKNRNANFISIQSLLSDRAIDLFKNGGVE